MKSLFNKTLIFLHIPKTGGSTLGKILNRHFTQKESFIFNSSKFSDEWIKEFKKLPMEERKRIKYIRGHMPFGIHACLPQESFYVTILRNPIERIISLYYMALRSKKWYLHKLIKSKNLSFSEFVKSGSSGEIWNGQVRLISGASEKVEEINPSRISYNDLKKAKENLKKYFLVGTTEKFDEFLVILRHMLGLKRIYYTKEAVARNKPRELKLSDEEISLLKEYNKFDFQLHEFAEELFRERVSEMDISLEEEVKKFRARNKLYGAMLSKFSDSFESRSKSLKVNLLNLYGKFRRRFSRK